VQLQSFCEQNEHPDETQKKRFVTEVILPNESVRGYMNGKFSEIKGLYPSTTLNQFELWWEWIWRHYMRQKQKNILKKIRAKAANSSHHLNVVPPATAAEVFHQKPTRQCSSELGDPAYGHEKAKIQTVKTTTLSYFKTCVVNGLFTVEEGMEALLCVQDEMNLRARTQEEGVIIDDPISMTHTRRSSSSGSLGIPSLSLGLSDHEDNSGEQMDDIEPTGELNEPGVSVSGSPFTPVLANPLQPSAFESIQPVRFVPDSCSPLPMARPLPQHARATAKTHSPSAPLSPTVRPLRSRGPIRAIPETPPPLSPSLLVSSPIIVPKAMPALYSSPVLQTTISSSSGVSAVSRTLPVSQR